MTASEDRCEGRDEQLRNRDGLRRYESVEFNSVKGVVALSLAEISGGLEKNVAGKLRRFSRNLHSLTRWADGPGVLSGMSTFKQTMMVCECSRHDAS